MGLCLIFVIVGQSVWLLITKIAFTLLPQPKPL